jgi:4-diphosphocytidyl-2-C-methyl-D-erythritol kinase
VITFPNCKINLGLNITSKRDDGYHNLETVFVPIHFTDVLEIIHADNTAGSIQYSSTGIAIDSKPSDNLCVKAYDLLKKDFPAIPPIKLHLHKTIPAGAGLGGGSADGAFMLKMLNTKFNLGLSTEQLIHYALQLGSDCPFFIYNKPCFASGRGEIMEPVELNLSAYKILIVNPGVHITTGQAFSRLTPAKPAVSINEIIKQPINTWTDSLKNDFEKNVFSQYPEIKEIKEILYKSGAVYSSMSGSGSTVYGIFEKSSTVNVSFPQHYFVKESEFILS